ncbi:hypothetical protein [Sphingopyxis sp. 550A]
MMTVILNQIRRLVERLSPAPACSGCLTERLADVDESSVGIALNELAVRRGFGWTQDVCGLCGKTRQVIGKRGSGIS